MDENTDIEDWLPKELFSHPDIQPGDILIAVNAGLLWLPFFPLLGGLVLDTGSLGQHAASTAREYGIPAASLYACPPSSTASTS
jgi:phosphoenolpyruvate synthase/pyruvate phosphate dikinase